MTDVVAHEWIESNGGSERVFEAMARCLPNAELVTLSVEPGTIIDHGNRCLQTTFLDKGLFRARRSLALPLMPIAWRRVAQNRRYEKVLISHHAQALQFARHCKSDVNFAYVHTPARYVWTPDLDERGGSAFLGPARNFFQRLDLKAVEHIDLFAANSLEVANRINDHWGRDAKIIHPPVDTSFFGSDSDVGPPSRAYILGFSRFVAYKRLDLVIQTGEILGWPVVIAGGGPAEMSLRKMASSARVPVTFEIRPSNERLRTLYRNAACLVFPAHEDFGIVPVEAQAAGTPVVGVRRGGILETVRHGKTGILVDEQSADSLAQGARLSFGLSPSDCRENAMGFSAQRFEKEILEWINLA